MKVLGKQGIHSYTNPSVYRGFSCIGIVTKYSLRKYEGKRQFDRRVIRSVAYVGDCSGLRFCSYLPRLGKERQ